MRIVNLMLGKKLGGLEQVAYDYHYNLAKKGHQLLTILRNGAELDVSTLKETEIVYIEPSPIPLITNRKIKKLINEFAADIVIGHGKRPLHYLKSIQLSCPKLYVAHNYRSKPDCLKMDHCIAVSSSVSAHLQKIGFPENNIHIIHNMTQMSSVKQNTDLKKTPTFGLLSRLHENKGIDIFLKAFKKLNEQTPGAKAIIAGKGPKEDELKTLTKNLGLEDQVDFIGWITDKRKFFSDIDIFVLPSRVEPFGITVIEAMASGTPMIVTDCAGPISFVTHEKEAYIVPREDEDALAIAMNTLLNTPSLRKNIQHHQAISTSKFTPETITNELEIILNQIIKN